MNDSQLGMSPDATDSKVVATRLSTRPGSELRPRKRTWQGGDESRPRASLADWPDLPGYEPLCVLGQGGMALVFEARQIKLDRIVAVKVAWPDSIELRARMIREAKLAAAIHHPNIVEVYDLGEHGDAMYLVMERLRGSLDEFQVQVGKQPDPWKVATIITPLARALAELHHAGILHRDLKPANILLDDAGQPKIADFGLARSLVGQATTLTRNGVIVGTYQYMSPEQFEGGDLGPASDIYSLGTILYELLTGVPPFRGANPLDLMFRVKHWEPIPPRKLNPLIPADLEAICLTCLEKKPARRYPNADALAEDLERFLNSQSVRVRATSPLVRLWRNLKQRPLCLALSSGGVFVLIGLTTASIIQTVLLSQTLLQSEDRIRRLEAETFVQTEHQEEQRRQDQERLDQLGKSLDLLIQATKPALFAARQQAFFPQNLFRPLETFEEPFLVTMLEKIHQATDAAIKATENATTRTALLLRTEAWHCKALLAMISNKFGNLDTSLHHWVETAERLDPFDQAISAEHLDALTGAVVIGLHQNRLDLAKHYLERLEAIQPNTPFVQDLRHRVESREQP